MRKQFQSTLAITGERAEGLAKLPATDLKFQSTLAITGERAVLPLPDSPMMAMFQSTLAITGERAAGVGYATAYMLRFNPRSPLLASEPTFWLMTLPRLLFQSTLAITGERAPLAAEIDGQVHAVSIHARHYWRASLLERSAAS